MTPKGRLAPLSGGGEVAQAGPLRRSARGWRPSTECLTNIAHASLELATHERDLEQEEGDGCPVRAGGEQGLSDSTTLEHTYWLRECSFASQGVELCPRNHGEAMMLPYAQKVREAEISEFNSHVVNGMFGPALREQDFAAGPPLKAVWVYSKSKKDPNGFKARIVMQGFLMKQGLHFNLFTQLLLQ